MRIRTVGDVDARSAAAAYWLAARLATRGLTRRLRARLPRALMVLLALLAVALIDAGIASIFPPAGLIAAGVSLLGILTFNPAHVRKVTWPR
jgi:hypothetical protein